MSRINVRGFAARSASAGSSRRSRNERSRRVALACRRQRHSNVAGAVISGLEPAASSARRFEPNHSAALDVTRLAATLPTSPQARPERLTEALAKANRANFAPNAGTLIEVAFPPTRVAR